MRSTTALYLLLLFTLSLPLAAQSDLPSDAPVWDLFQTTQRGQFTYFDAPAGASVTGKPVDIGDFDANGCGDLAITGQNATHPIDGEWRGSAGHVRIVMNICTIAGQASAEMLGAALRGFTIYGAYAGDMAGAETAVADFNGDGYDDLLVSAQNSDGAEQVRSNSGAAFIVFGGADFASHADIDLRTMPDDVIAFYGASPEDRFGLWVEAGDFDGDGYQDAIIGANQADGLENLRPNAGEVWIIFGAADMPAVYGQITDMSEAPAEATRIIGADYDDLMGSTVWGADLNGDGYDDAIVSAALWRASSGIGGISFGGGDGAGNRRYNSGETFIVFGGETIRGQIIDLATLIDVEGRPIDARITVIYGRDANDLLGEEIATGDLDGDGRLDLILGTLVADGAQNNLDEAGEAWVIYTHEPFAGQMIDLFTPEPGRSVVIFPDQADSKAGDTLRAADLDLDGIDDLFYGAPDYDPFGADGVMRHNAGMMAVLFGELGGLPNDDETILLSNPPDDLRVRYLIGGEANDMMPYALAVGDINGDGVIDIAPNAMGGDGAGNAFQNAGEIYIVSGSAFLSDELASIPSSAPTAAGVTVTPTIARTPTPHPESTAVSQSGNLEYGRLHFLETCAGCHGYLGEGVAGLGLPIVTSPLVVYASDADLLAFLREGRAADHPDNVTGVAMPPSGGRPDWTDQDLLDLIAYLRWLRDRYAPQTP